MSGGNFLVLKSSAGSGKTFALVYHFLRLALTTSDPAGYRHILAITFTNAAAAEMKDRVMKMLGGFAAGRKNPDFDDAMFELLKSNTRISEEDLITRSREMHRHILHNYNLLSISTIDSFVHRLIRSFSFDLKLQSDFRVEIETSRFLREIVDQCLERVGNDQELTTYMEQFVISEIDNESSWDIRSKLLSFAEILFNEDSIVPLDALEALSTRDFATIRSDLKAKCQAFESEVKKHGAILRELISDIPPAHFYHADAPKFIERLCNGSVTTYGIRLAKAVESDKHYSSKTPLESRRKIEAISNQLSAGLLQVNEMLTGSSASAYHQSLLVLKNLYLIGLLSELDKAGLEWRQANNTILVADFHRKIADVVRDNPTPFIYERAGTRYRHILIDEFQDTSELQWKNFLPLIENSLASGNFSLLVGDAKQAIYRWRNGKVEQFIKLPETNGRKNLLLHSAFRLENLENNYRSSRRIVEFNNALFNHLKSRLGTNEFVFDDSNQKTTREVEGYVSVKSLREDESDDPEDAIFSQVLSTVKQCLDDGFDPQDIAILLRRNKGEITPVADYLTRNGVPIQTDESFLLINSKQVNLILSAFRYLAISTDHEYAIRLASGLCESSLVSGPFEHVLQKHSNVAGRSLAFDINTFLHENFPQLPELAARQLAPSDLAFSLVSLLKIELDAYTENFLDHFFSRQRTHRESLPQFLKWFDENSQKLYAFTAQQNAVKIMTIHKSKGLQFPVVIYPMFETRFKGRFLWIDSTSIHPKLKYAFVRFSQKNEFPPPEFKTEMEQQQLDELNLTYVAATRAEDRLYMIIEGSSRKQLELVSEFENAIKSAFPQSSIVDGDWQIGNRLTKQLSERKKTKPEISMSGSGLFQPVAQEDDDRNVSNVMSHALLRRGKIIHWLLADKSVNQRNGYRMFALGNQEYDLLQSEAERIRQHKNFSRWFRPEIICKTEVEILTPDGAVLRPDRIVFLDSHIEVVDFKTGERQEGHMLQVRSYTDILKKMYQTTVKGFIAYLDNSEVIEVD